MSAHTAPNPAPVKLVIEDDEGKKTIVPIVRDEITIGRKDGNTIRLTERNVSRFHARLMRQETQIFIEDLNSYTGVRVNGDRIAGRVTVGEGDLIEIGDYHLALQHEGGGEALASQTGAGEATVRDMPPMLLTEETVKVPMPLQFAEEAKLALAPAPLSVPPTAGVLPPLAPVAASAVAERPLSRAEPTALIRPELLEAEAKAKAAAVAGAEIPERERAKLVVVATTLAGKEIVLVKRETVLGRTDDNDVVLDHRSVSRNHAKVVYDGSAYSIVDLKSANGVLVNGEEYSQTALRPGDIVELGHVRLRFIEPGGHFKLTDEEIAAIKAEAAEIENSEVGATTNVTERFARGPIDAEFRSKRRLLGVAAGVLVLAGGAVGAWVLLSKPPKPVAVVTDAALAVEPPLVPVRPVEPPVAEGPRLSAEEIDGLIKSARESIATDDFGSADAAISKVLKADPSNETAKGLFEKVALERAAAEDVAAAEVDHKAGRPEDALAKLDAIPDKTQARVKALKRANEIREELAAEHEKAARAALESEDFEAARSEVEIGLKLVPQSRSLKEVLREIDNSEKAVIAKAPPGKKPPAEKIKKPVTVAAKETRSAKGNPDEANKLYLEGNRLILQGRFKDAIDKFKQALVADSKFADAHRGLGIAYAKLSKNDLAVHHYELYLQLRPFAPDADRVRQIIKEYKATKTNT